MTMSLNVCVGVLLVVLGCMPKMKSINGEVYKVGDTAGWTTIGNVDYKQWAATKSFQLGDIVVFEYNSQFHNVMQVTHLEYRSCNTSAPIATHTTGNDSITIATRGHHYFLCGVPGHCQSGQKVDINVLRASSVSPTPSSSPSPPVEDASAPAPNESEAPQLFALCRCIGNLVVAMAVFAAFV